MSALIDSLKTRIAKYLNISTRLINEVTIIVALPYSEYAIEEIEKTIDKDGLSKLSDINTKELEDSNDTILVCKCVLNDKTTLVSLVLDPEELYQSSAVLKIVPL